MAQGTRICKICGKEYPYCKTAFVPGAFRYQDVACCAEHGSEYLFQVIASREEPKKEPATVSKAKKVTKSTAKKVTTEPVAKATEKTEE